MARETLNLSNAGFRAETLSTVVDVEYREVPHYLGPHAEHLGRKMSAYDVYVGGEWGMWNVGRIEHAVESTDRHPRGSRIRIPGRGRLAWAWRSEIRKDKYGNAATNAPGLYCSSRRAAVARIMGYWHAEKVTS